MIKNNILNFKIKKKAKISLVAFLSIRSDNLALKRFWGLGLQMDNDVTAAAVLFGLRRAQIDGASDQQHQNEGQICDEFSHYSDL